MAHVAAKKREKHLSSLTPAAFQDTSWRWCARKYPQLPLGCGIELANGSTLFIENIWKQNDQKPVKKLNNAQHLKAESSLVPLNVSVKNITSSSCLSTKGDVGPPKVLYQEASAKIWQTHHGIMAQTGTEHPRAAFADPKPVGRSAPSPRSPEETDLPFEEKSICWSGSNGQQNRQKSKNVLASNRISYMCFVKAVRPPVRTVGIDHMSKSQRKWFQYISVQLKSINCSCEQIST